MKRMALLAGTLAALPPSLNEMERWTRLRLVAPNGVTESGYCERFVHKTYLFPFPDLGDDFHTGSAIGSAALWADSAFVIDDFEQSLPGDIFYWTQQHGPNGHTAIRIQGNQVAENSIVHWDGADSRGVRPLDALDTPDLVIRLTASAVAKYLTP